MPSELAVYIKRQAGAPAIVYTMHHSAATATETPLTVGSRPTDRPTRQRSSRQTTNPSGEPARSSQQQAVHRWSTQRTSSVKHQQLLMWGRYPPHRYLPPYWAVFIISQSPVQSSSFPRVQCSLHCVPEFSAVFIVSPSPVRASLGPA
jgi:hypothetical protein